MRPQPDWLHPSFHFQMSHSHIRKSYHFVFTMTEVRFQCLEKIVAGATMPGREIMFPHSVVKVESVCRFWLQYVTMTTIVHWFFCTIIILKLTLVVEKWVFVFPLDTIACFNSTWCHRNVSIGLSCTYELVTCKASSFHNEATPTLHIFRYTEHGCHL